MNCRQTRDLLSAYLDQELTGQQMLDLHAHLSACASCARECRDLREVRRLLRGLAQRLPDTAAERKLTVRLDREALREADLFPWTDFLMHWRPARRWELTGWVAGPRPRGRSLASALALSSVAMLAVIAPVAAPPTDDAAGRAAALSAFRAGPISASFVTLPTGWNSGPLFVLHSLFAPPPSPAAEAPASALAQQYAQPAAQAMEAEPFRDDTVSGYVQGATLADYQSPAGGR